VFQSHCRYLNSLQNGNGIGFYARVNQLDGTNSQVCGRFYFTECEFIYGDAGIDASSYWKKFISQTVSQMAELSRVFAGCPTPQRERITSLWWSIQLSELLLQHQKYY
jgi:hypothetical protein